MLLSVLELERITVEDIMIPRHLIVGVDFSQNEQKILNDISKSSYSNLLIYNDDFDNLIGILSLKKIIKLISGNTVVTLEDIKKLILPAYCIPNSATVQKQLIKFQEKGTRFAVVVDEYGAIDGILTIEDILEEIVGEFSDNYQIEKHIKKQKDSWIIAGDTTLREISRHTNLFLVHKKGIKTLSGYIIDFIEDIPSGLCSFKANNLKIEVIKIYHKKIKTVKITQIKL